MERARAIDAAAPNCWGMKQNGCATGRGLPIPWRTLQETEGEEADMARGTQLCVSLENKPGQLAKLTATLAQAKVNIEAISVVDTATCCLVRLVTSSNAKAKAALSRAGLTPCQQPVILLKLADAPGALAGVAKKLADKGVNIDYVYGSAAGAGKPSLLVLGVDDIAKALKIL